MCSGDNERALVFYSYMTGTLAATPYLWWFIFKSLYSFNLFTTWVTTIFYWSIVPLHLVVLGLCSIRRKRWLETDSLQWACVIAVALTVLWALFAEFALSIAYVAPALYILNLLMLAPYVPVTARVAYLAPPVAHRYYQLGFCGAFIVYYLLMFKRIFVSRVFWLPFIVFLIGGFLALLNLQSHSTVGVGKQRRRAIFMLPRKYVTYSWQHAWELCRREITVFAMLVATTVAATMSTGMVTHAMTGLNKYLSLFCVGLFGRIGISFCGPRKLLFYVPLATVLLTLLHVLGPTSETLANGAYLFLLFYIVMLEAMDCVIITVRHKLSRAINGPDITLSLCSVGNLLLTCVLYLVNKAG
ncbi:envelope UL43 [Colobine gammaherpesvirus 1]|uniref:Envelope UL43 n=1 Tax=Colobine gammaherpesvirus 1 TaxID=2597325 RepID=A0A5B8G6M3_9GAMA|nr:envelope UL43 [Colobine gammaherpesvirus 1]QDQ69269.1 envelope UL43 [Colobine gammaherpesvirus 1]